MHTFLDAKTMAKSLRTALADRHVDISHSDSLELVARQFGFDNWNILAARIDAAREAILPPDWLLHQEGQRLYRIATRNIDPLLLALEARADALPDYSDFGSVMQQRGAADYRGASLSFTAELKGEEVDAASVWMRVDDRQGRRLAFDNLLRKPGAALAGSFDWTPISVELPVATEAERVAYGILLKGRGRLQIRAPRLAPISGESVAA